MTDGQGVDDLELLLIDGDNLLHEVRGTRDEGGVAWLLPRLSGWRPAHLRIVVGLDGHPAPGETGHQRVARGIEFHHSGSRSADDMLIDLLRSQPVAGRMRTAVVTRDRSLRARAVHAGGVTRTIDWLMREVAGGGARGGSAGPVRIGQAKPPVRPRPQPDQPEADDRAGWAPGRGATRKRGNPRRPAKRSRRR